MLATSRTRSATTFGHGLADQLSGITNDPQSLLESTRFDLSYKMANPPNYQLDLDILSAESYPTALTGISPSLSSSRGQNKRKSSKQLMGGLLTVNSASELDPADKSPVEESSRPKKRQRRSTKAAEDEENNRKQRGRPRLDTQDETAADRRRTQIRLAQRAYRQRKETTIVALKGRVTEMKNQMELMDQLFQQFHDGVFNSGLLGSSPALANDLHNIATRFGEAVKITTSHDSDQDADEEGSTRLQDGESAETAVNAKKVERIPRDVGSAPWGYEFSFGPTSEVDADNQTQPPLQASQRLLAADIVDKNWPTVEKSQQFDIYQLRNTVIDIPALRSEIERPIKTTGSYTYSFQETTFARRLQRLCLEHGYRILTSPNTDPAYLNRRYKLTFCITNRKRMVERFQELLKRKAGESLENWRVPYIRVGGAGTHFPRRDDQGNPVYPPNMISPADFFGPMVPIAVETPRDKEETYKQMLEELGYGGEWFDSHDVEEYLKTKGIYLDGSSSFVDVDINSITLPALTVDSSSSSSTGSSPTSVPTPQFTESAAVDPVSSTTATQDSTSPTPLYGYPAFSEKLSAYTNVNDPAFSFPSPLPGPLDPAWDPEFSLFSSASTPPEMPTPPTKSRMVTVDVNRFLERMVINAGVCLGRAPGFRKEQVDIALALSLQEAF